MRNRQKKKFWCLVTNQDPGTFLMRVLSFCLKPALILFACMSDEEDLASHSFETRVIIQLTVYTSNRVTSGSGKNKKKTKSKGKKTKEVTFTLSTDNYLEFLQCLLTKHGQNTLVTRDTVRSIGKSFVVLYLSLDEK